MKNHKKLSNSSEAGFSHAMILIAILVLAGIVGTGILVAKNNKKTTSNSTTSSTTQPASKASAAKNTAAATPLSTTAANTPVTTSSSPKSSSSKSTSGSSTPSTPANPPAAPTTPAETPLSALTALITKLKNGENGNVTAQNIAVPGPISTAQARPLIFTLNGQTYFAYTQGQKPNFSTSAAQTAGSMAIVKATSTGGGVSVVHLDKSGNLVDENIALVGFSTGGN